MNPAVKKIRLYIEEHFAEEVKLRDLGILSRLSPFHLIRVFQKEYGVSPHEYLVQVRIEEAQKMLQIGLPIVEVAHNTGFSDQSHLTRWFKTRLGITPGQYRKLLINHGNSRASSAFLFHSLYAFEHGSERISGDSNVACEGTIQRQNQEQH